ncbi:polyprenyl synthetase [Peptoniphilus duerdenii ATCC BAA-1640]|uniref:Farnesyl diphosphate synthase n=1 Tax=Peptoniphilus duerdenii ATCC BAA-1640 TaxID=862517 RepID=E0NMX3_9FIRM|nr:polyprenyl synthetase family protein [Peptoniphilus duerdenii]EFM24941.1 polyprenyl synthetase [Peptoniphilus duerdenii ATCC BAA-1640]
MTTNRYEELINIIDQNLYTNIPTTDDFQKKIYESMKYSLSTGGKRVRPILALVSYSIFNDDSKNFSEIIPFAVALEYIHTYSLIHDDLPAMDNDDIRRGKPTNHKVYNEAIAILAGDGLLNLAAEVVAKELEGITDPIKLKRAIKSFRYIFSSSGIQGMVGGQTIDIDLSVDEMSLEEVETMYKLKTGALIKAPLAVGAIMGGATPEELISIEGYAEQLGLQYQIKDDILDYEDDLNSDVATLSKLVSKEELESLLMKTYNKAINYLEEIDRNTDELKNIARDLLNRSK